jgi:hypothetical protein
VAEKEKITKAQQSQYFLMLVDYPTFGLNKTRAKRCRCRALNKNENTEIHIFNFVSDFGIANSMD